MIGLASSPRKRKGSTPSKLDTTRTDRFASFVALAKRRRGTREDADASYWDLLPYEIQERIVKESEVMEDMEKGREKARRWAPVHEEMMKLPRCHRHGTVRVLFFLWSPSAVPQGDVHLFFSSLSSLGA